MAFWRLKGSLIRVTGFGHLVIRTWAPPTSTGGGLSTQALQALMSTQAFSPVGSSFDLS